MSTDNGLLQSKVLPDITAIPIGTCQSVITPHHIGCRLGRTYVGMQASLTEWCIAPVLSNPADRRVSHALYW